MGILFGTDGIRGVANTDLTCQLAYNVGRAGAYVLTKEMNHAPRILVAKDTRISGDMLGMSIASGICSVGAHAIFAGVIPTPAVAHLVREYKLDAGIMISASHNPVEYNGIKFFNSEGYKLRDSLEAEIEELLVNSLFNNITEIPLPTGEEIGKASYRKSALTDYENYLKSAVLNDLTGIKIALDCANGASYKAAPNVFRDLGAEVFVTANEPDGTNINKNCGSTCIDNLKRFVEETGADVGFAFDGDADRCLCVDEEGNEIDGDKILAICGLNMKIKGTLKKDTVVGTVMSNLGLDIMTREHDMLLVKTAVGDRYVLEEMLKNGYNLGGEQSGHIIFLDKNSTGDGILTALNILQVMKDTGKKMSQLGGLMKVLPQVLVNATVSNIKKNTFMEYKEIRRAIRNLEAKYEDTGRVLIRTSGTEPLVRVMIEGENIAEIEKDARDLAQIIETFLS
ncbi:MAG: phosphoglucosamine mutase [Firmicutes bacterium]|nr:phosphoglucosamine mutase [Bacillota bacterium]